MNSEKVKEIKKALECWQESVMLSTDENYISHRVSNREILDYINELESDNERLSSRYRNLEINYNDTWEHYREYEVENQQLKDRIAELEKENARLLDSVETVQSNRCVYKCVLTKEHLTKFAEMLKEKKTKRLIPVGLVQPAKEVWFIKLTEEEIDETLKEFISGEVNREDYAANYKGVR